MMYGLINKEDKKKRLAKDHWGRVILFVDKEDAIKFVEGTNCDGWEWEIKETKIKYIKFRELSKKYHGNSSCLSDSYFRNG